MPPLPVYSDSRCSPKPSCEVSKSAESFRPDREGGRKGGFVFFVVSSFASRGTSRLYVHKRIGMYAYADAGRRELEIASVLQKLVCLMQF